MNDKDIWSVGIYVEHGSKGWAAKSEWQCGKIGNPGYIEGVVGTRYEEPTLKDAIDNVVKFLNRLGIKRSDELDELKTVVGFAISCKDIKDKEEVQKEAEERGWKLLMD